LKAGVAVPRDVRRLATLDMVVVFLNPSLRDGNNQQSTAMPDRIMGQCI
jgi:hypothetical protein